MPVPKQSEKNIERIDLWSKDVFLFAEEVMNMKASEPIDELRGKPIHYKDEYGKQRTILLFDADGRLTHYDLSFYKMEMFKHQGNTFKRYKGSRLTWQQTVEFEAYQRGISTFGQDSYDMEKRWITIRSGHGIGKTSFESIIAIHFLTCFFGAQIGVTANTEDQLKDIFLKEFSKWKMRLPEYLGENMDVLDDVVRIKGEKDWFLRARVARPEKPEALAGLHGDYVLIIVDEASAVHDKVFEVMKGALTGENYLVIYASNPTRTEGEFYESHKEGSSYTKLHFNTRHSPIVKEGYIENMESDYPANEGETSDEVKVRVDGEFVGEAEMNEKGWIPLFANVPVRFEKPNMQIIKGGIIGVDPAGQGRDSSLIGIRDNVYLKELLNEKTSTEKDLARKIETFMLQYEVKAGDVGVDGFGIGSKVIANINTKLGEHINSLLTDKPREDTEHLYSTMKAELAWKFREWCMTGGIIITHNERAWLKEMNKIKYTRDGRGRIVLMNKVEFKKENKFSPDRFDMALYTFFKDEPTRQVNKTKAEIETNEMAEFMKRAKQMGTEKTSYNNFSSM